MAGENINENTTKRENTEQQTDATKQQANVDQKLTVGETILLFVLTIFCTFCMLGMYAKSTLEHTDSVNAAELTNVEVNEISVSNVPDIAQETEITEEVKIEDSCENPIGAVHYPSVISLSKGNSGSIVITTAEHGTTFDGTENILTGLPIGTSSLKTQKGYVSKENALKTPIEIDSRGHEIIITMAFGFGTARYKMNSGDSKLLSVKKSSSSTSEMYVYVIVD